MYRFIITKQNRVLLFLCLIFAGCSYTPYRYSFSLIDPQNETLQNDVVGKAMSYEDIDVEFRFVLSSENIQMAIKNKTDHEIYIIRDNAEYIDCYGESHRIHYGYDYVQEARNFAVTDGLFTPSLRVGPDSEIAGCIWINIWPAFCIGNDWTFNSDALINYLMEPLFPRHSFEGSVEDLKSLTFNLILPIDFDGYMRNYTFTFMIDDVI